MLRNGTRAMSLGPLHLGPYLWLGVFDQRISIWTSLLSPSLLILAIINKDMYIIKILVLWIVLSRSFYMLVLFFFYRLRPLSAFHVPMLLCSQWSNSLIKIYTLMFLSKQKWTNTHKSTKLNSANKWSRSDKILFLRGLAARVILCVQIVIFIFFVVSIYGLISIKDLFLFL